ncbi:MAG: MFS transporter [Clostridia bacterium]|nr:MFS transporter [Clostridia bacterium]
MNEYSVKEAERLAQTGTDEQVNKQLEKLVNVDRRVVSRKETIGYMLFEANNDFNINGHKSLFTDSILKISLDKQALFNGIAGVWDIVDDLLIGGVVERTRTRWGKFVPYLFISGMPYAIFSTLYWLMPAMFSQQQIDNLDYLPKFILFMLLEMTMEAFSTFKSIAVGGYLSTITPYPSDRRRLLAISKYFTMIYARIPDMVIEFMLDFITNDIIFKGRSSAEMIKMSLMIVGPFTAIISGIINTWYSTIARERVHQSIEKPHVWQSIKVVFANRPVLAYMISNSLGAFGTGISTNNYYRWVLFMTTFETIAGIPSVFFQPFGYAKYNDLAKRYSTKSLYMVSQIFAKTFYIPIWFYGMFIKGKDGKPFFTNRWAMLPVTMIWECIYATFWGVKSISANEIGNELNDYIEWKYGYRNEATLSVAGTIFGKIPNRINGILEPMYKKWIGYDQEAYPEKRPQPERAQKWIFSMATIITAIVVIIGVLPMFGYNIDKEKRDEMYSELNRRRVSKAAEINEAYEAESEQ